MSWIKVSDVLPDEGITVKTKIDDHNGSRNEAILIRRGSLWFS